MANPAPDSIPPSLSMLRRHLISASPAEPVDADSGAINFDSVEDTGLLRGMSQASRPTPPPGYDEVEALLHRYQAEKGISSDADPRPAPTSSSRRNSSSDMRGSSSEMRGSGSSLSGESPRSTRNGLPALTTTSNAESERLKAENADLRALAQEYRELLEANDPAVWEQRVTDLQQQLAERTEELASSKKQLDEWNQKFATHRFVARDEELAKEADELDKERSTLAQDRKQLEDDRRQLKDDEESLMKQMRDMEMSMAKDRAEIARQRTDLQRMQAEIKHEAELLQRGDASVKERMAAFQRRPQDSVRGAPQAQAPVPEAPTEEALRPRDSSVFKKLFGQGK